LSKTANKKKQETAPPTSKKVVTFEVTTTTPAQPTKPKDWCKLQDEWLHSTMQAEMDDESLQGILTMTGYCEGKQSSMANQKMAVVTT